ncbi:MAG: DNA polymerase beta superfamily protein [Saprospiraceae bacterium]
MDINTLLSNKDWLLFDAVSGSHAYGTALPTSDEDRRGVFVLPKDQFYGLENMTQVNDERNDLVYYEVGRFLDLLAKNNPNMLEMLASPEDCIRYKHPLYDIIKPEYFISKLCFQTFAGYAISQIKKARGLNKKIVNPLAEERKSVLEFCYMIHHHGSITLAKWLEMNGYVQENCGLVNIPHFKDVYAVFYDASGELGFKGIIQKPTANEVALSSVPAGKEKVGILSFNKDGYQTYCKDYRQYWEWVELRNEARYENTLAHGKQYDAKNMMHTFRLLDMAAEIAQFQEIRVRRPNVDFLLDIRRGEFEYEQLLHWAEEKIQQIEILYQNSTLPEQPDLQRINQLLIDIRSEWYQ